MTVVKICTVDFTGTNGVADTQTRRHAIQTRRVADLGGRRSSSVKWQHQIDAALNMLFVHQIDNPDLFARLGIFCLNHAMSI